MKNEAKDVFPVGEVPFILNVCMKLGFMEGAADEECDDQTDQGEPVGGDQWKPGGDDTTDQSADDHAGIVEEADASKHLFKGAFLMCSFERIMDQGIMGAALNGVADTRQGDGCGKVPESGGHDDDHEFQDGHEGVNQNHVLTGEPVGDHTCRQLKKNHHNRVDDFSPYNLLHGHAAAGPEEPFDDISEYQPWKKL